MKLGNKIASRRKELGLTQQELADKLYVSVKTISKWETNRGNPEIEILPSLAKILQMDINDLFSFDEPNKEDRNGENMEEFNNQYHFDNYFPKKKAIPIEGIIKIVFGVLGLLFFFGPFTSIKIEPDIITFPIFQITHNLSGYDLMFNLSSKLFLIILYIICTWVLFICYFTCLLIGALEVAELKLEFLNHKNKIINVVFWLGYACVVYSILFNVISSNFTLKAFTVLIFLKHNALLGYQIYNKKFKKNN